MIKNFKFWLLLTIAIGLTIGLSIGNYIDAVDYSGMTEGTNRLDYFSTTDNLQVRPLVDETSEVRWFKGYYDSTTTVAGSQSTSGGTTTIEVILTGGVENGDGDYWIAFLGAAYSKLFYLRLHFDLATETWSLLTDNTYAQCSEYTNSTECWTNTSCFWDYSMTGPSVCRPQGYYAVCGDIGQCFFCETENECLNTASSTCTWTMGYWDKFNRIINDEPFVPGCSYNIPVEPESTSTTQTPSGIAERMEKKFYDRVPFAYIYAVRNSLDELALSSASGTLENITLTIPTTTLGTTTVGTRIDFPGFNLPLFTKTLFFQIASEERWHELRALLSATIWILLGLWLFNKMKTLNIF